MSLTKSEERWVNSLISQLAMSMRREAAQLLLAGNDLCCFTTAQYKAAYYRRENRTAEDAAYQAEIDDRYSRVIGKDWGRMHLESIPEVVREVKPDLWAARETVLTTGEG